MLQITCEKLCILVHNTHNDHCVVFYAQVDYTVLTTTGVCAAMISSNMNQI